MAASPIAADFERLLASEGLAPIASAYSSDHDPDDSACAVVAAVAADHAADVAAHADAYTKWAQGINMRAYSSKAWEIWRLHGLHYSHADVAATVKVDVSAVRRVVDTIVRRNPGGPRNLHDTRHRDHGPRLVEAPASLEQLAETADAGVVSELLLVAMEVLRERGLLDDVAERCERNPELADLVPANVNAKGPTMLYRHIEFSREVHFPGKLGVKAPGSARLLKDVEAEPTRDGLLFELVIGRDAVKQLVPWSHIVKAVYVPQATQVPPQAKAVR